MSDIQNACSESYERFAMFNELSKAENMHPESNVRFPLSAMYEFARIIWGVDRQADYNGYHIYSVHFDSLSATNSMSPGVYAVRMHCQIKRFEEFIERHGAVITHLSLYDDQQLHVDAVVRNNILGWFEVTAIYNLEDLPQGGCSGSIRDRFLAHASARGWKVK